MPASPAGSTGHTGTPSRRRTARTPYYDTEALIAGQDSLTEIEAAGIREAIGAVAGLDVLHLQCHIGFDAISLARRGARVVGADFSPRLAGEGAHAGQRAAR